MNISVMQAVFVDTNSHARNNVMWIQWPVNDRHTSGVSSLLILRGIHENCCISARNAVGGGTVASHSRWTSAPVTYTSDETVSIIKQNLSYNKL